tara:strand:- start:2076 stop:2528 length:453 start_codon:yes stop_codon:yes gene_type:complete
MTSWNKGKTGLAAGWTPERRRVASERQRAWCKANPNANFFKYDKTSRWKTGPDPEVRKHYYRFLRMRCQAKYWCQEWSILWEDYLDLLKSSSAKWGRTKDSHNLVRINTQDGWHLSNVQLMNRQEAMRRKRAVDSQGRVVRRRRRNEQQR